MFDKYKDIHLGDSAYLLGSGPTVKDFTVENHPGVYVGVNDIYLLPHIKDKLNYLMTEKYFPEIELISNDVPIFCFAKCKTKRSYFGYKPHHMVEMSDVWRGTILEVWKRFNECGSITFHGFFLAIHLGCKKIHLVGCDCTKKRAMPTSTRHECNQTYEKLVPGWKAIKEYTKEHHPDVEIININPVNLKDMFPSIYTDDSL